jgi:hypothetical protein
VFCMCSRFAGVALPHPHRKVASSAFRDTIGVVNENTQNEIRKKFGDNSGSCHSVQYSYFTDIFGGESRSGSIQEERKSEEEGEEFFREDQPNIWGEGDQLAPRRALYWRCVTVEPALSPRSRLT